VNQALWGYKACSEQVHGPHAGQDNCSHDCSTSGHPLLLMAFQPQNSECKPSLPPTHSSVHCSQQLPLTARRAGLPAVVLPGAQHTHRGQVAHYMRPATAGHLTDGNSAAFGGDARPVAHASTHGRHTAEAGHDGWVGGWAKSAGRRPIGCVPDAAVELFDSHYQLPLG
jgi:hypothetical protein